MGIPEQERLGEGDRIATLEAEIDSIVESVRCAGEILPALDPSDPLYLAVQNHLAGLYRRYESARSELNQLLIKRFDNALAVANMLPETGIGNDGR